MIEAVFRSLVEAGEGAGKLRQAEGSVLDFGVRTMASSSGRAAEMEGCERLADGRICTPGGSPVVFGARTADLTAVGLLA